MADKNTKLSIIIDAQNKATSGLSAVSKDLGSLEKGVEGASSGFLGMAKGIAGVAAAYISFTKITEAASLGLTVAADMQTAEVGLKTLLGSSEEAADTIARLKVEAARTPFELPGLTQATQLLSSVTKDGDKSIDILLDVGEALAAMGKGQEELDRLVINMQQIAAVGYAATIDIKQFAFAGIPIYEMLAETTGKTGEALQDMISNGEITFDVLTKMFDEANDAGGRFHNAFVNQSGTFNQAASNMKDSFGIMMQDIVTRSGLFEGITNAMIRASEVMGNWQGVIGGVGENMGNFFTMLDEKTLLVTHLKAAFDNMVSMVTSALKPAIDELWIALQPLMPYLEAMGQVIAGVLVVALHALIGAFQIAIGIITAVLAGLTNLVTFITDTATFAFRTLQNAVELVAAVFTGDWGGAITAVKNQIADLIDWVENLIEMFKRAIDLAKEVGGGAIKSVKSVLPGRASGGPVTGNMPYMVGEKGPELFVPSSSGNIIPNNRLNGGGGLSITITGNTFMSNEDAAETIGDMIIGRLKLSSAL